MPRTARLSLAALLLFPLAVTLWFAGSAGLETRVSAASPSRMLGPNNPPIIDTNGDGLASPGDQTVGVSRMGNAVTVDSPWDCTPGDGDNVFDLVNPDGNGRSQTVRRNWDGGSQLITITGVANNGSPTTFAFTETKGRKIRTGTGELLDDNMDGVTDGFSGTETVPDGSLAPAPLFSVSLVQSDTNADGNPDYLSFPWSQASALGVNTMDTCGPGGIDPQVWIPMADTNNDGINDGLVFDLDGDGVGDTDLFTTPGLTRASGQTRYIGPNFPVLIDTSGDGRPTPGVDLPLVPELADNILYIRSPWDTNPADTNNQFTLADMLGGGRFSQGTRTNGPFTQQLTLTTFSGNFPTGFTITQTGPRNRTGDLSLVDRNGDGVFDGLDGNEVGGGGLRASLSLVPADIDGDGKAEYVSLPWSQASVLGVNTGDNVGPGGKDPQIYVPLADTDGSGAGDSLVVDLNGDGVPDPMFYSSPPVADGAIRYSMAEGATGSFFDSFVLLANPTGTAAPVSFTYYKDAGNPVTQALTVPPTSRVTLPVDAVAGMGSTAFGFQVDSTSGVALGVERSMYHDATYAGGSAEAAAMSPGTRWLFAEGCQCGFQTYFLLTNPGGTAATATLTFLLEGGLAPVTRTVSLPPTSRTTFPASSVSELTGRPFATIVDSDQRVIAERSMLFANNTASHESIGTQNASPFWYHAEGAIGPFFDTFILLANPNATAANVTLTIRPEAGGTITRTILLPAVSRGTYWVDNDLEPAVSGDLSITVAADQFIVSERSMYWPGALGQWVEGHNSFGETDPDTKWILAEGVTGGPLNFDTWLILGNPTATAAAVRLTFLRSNGQTVVKTTSVAANARLDYSVNASVAEVANDSFGVLVEVTNGIPIAVERSTYWSPGGAFWAGGSNALARRLP